MDDTRGRTRGEASQLNYRHAFHAGNFADVHKHVAVLSILSYLRKKSTPFCVVDTHAGRGIYQLDGQAAAQTGEAGQGIGQAAQHVAQNPLVASYLELTRTFLPDAYPGSPLLCAKFLREQDRLIAIELQVEECDALRACLVPYRNAHAICGDGYVQLPRLVPPPERRGLILIDPPYEQTNEIAVLASTAGAAYRRFPSGIYVIWYPQKSTAAGNALAGEILGMGVTKLLMLRLEVGRASADAPGRLSGSGILVINPPYGFSTEMEAAQTEILSLLRRGQPAGASVTWLAGGA